MDANCILWIVNCIALNRLSNVLEYCLKTSCIEVHLWLSKLSSHYRPRGDGVLLAGGWETGASQHALRGQLPRVPWDPHPYRLSHCHLLGDLCLSGSHHGQLLPGLHRPLLPALEQVHQVGQGRHGRVRRVRERWRGQEGEQEGEVRTRTVYTLILPQQKLAYPCCTFAWRPTVRRTAKRDLNCKQHFFPCCLSMPKVKLSTSEGNQMWDSLTEDCMNESLNDAKRFKGLTSRQAIYSFEPSLKTKTVSNTEHLESLSFHANQTERIHLNTDEGGQMYSTSYRGFPNSATSTLQHMHKIQ